MFMDFFPQESESQNSRFMSSRSTSGQKSFNLMRQSQSEAEQLWALLREEENPWEKTTVEGEQHLTCGMQSNPAAAVRLESVS